MSGTTRESRRRECAWGWRETSCAVIQKSFLSPRFFSREVVLNNPQRNSLSTCVHARMHARVIVRAQGDGMGGVHDHLICKHVAYYYSFFFIFLHLFVKENINSFMFKWTKSVLFFWTFLSHLLMTWSPPLSVAGPFSGILSSSFWCNKKDSVIYFVLSGDRLFFTNSHLMRGQ